MLKKQLTTLAGAMARKASAIRRLFVALFAGALAAVSPSAFAAVQSLLTMRRLLVCLATGAALSFSWGALADHGEPIPDWYVPEHFETSNIHCSVHPRWSAEYESCHIGRPCTPSLYGVGRRGVIGHCINISRERPGGLSCSPSGVFVPISDNCR